jgi:hypothetical protein
MLVDGGRGMVLVVIGLIAVLEGKGRGRRRVCECVSVCPLGKIWLVGFGLLGWGHTL